MKQSSPTREVLEAFGRKLQEIGFYGKVRVARPDGRIIGWVSRRGDEIEIRVFKRPLKMHPAIETAPTRIRDLAVHLKNPHDWADIDLAEIQRELDKEDRAN